MGKVQAVPDIATLNFGMQTGRQKTAQAAMEKLSKNMNQVFEAVKKAGVEEKDIKTRHLSLNPAYDYEDGKRKEQGFEANQSLVVKVRDLDTITDVLDAAVSAGANQAGNVSFTIDDPENLKVEARALAIANAKGKAGKLADDLGVDLGSISGFWEDTGGYPMPMMERSMAMDSMGIGGGAKVAPPLPAGEQEVGVNVSVTYKIN